MKRRAIGTLSVVGLIATMTATLLQPQALAAGHGAAASKKPIIDSSGVTGSDVLRVTTAKLPVSLGNGIPNKLDLGVLDVEGTSVRLPTKNKHSATSFSGLLSPTGTQLDALDALKASAAENKNVAQSLPGGTLPSTDGLLSGSALTGKATVTKTSDASNSDISIANLGALQLGDILGASTVKQVQTETNTLLTQANALITTLKKLVATAPTLGPEVKPIISSLNKLVVQLKNTNLSKIALVTVGTLIGRQSITHTSAGVPTATATTDLADLNILDGLLHVSAVKTTSISSAAGTPGSGKATGSALVGKVTLGKSGIFANISKDGKLLGLNIPGGLGKQVDSALTQLQKTLTGVLDTIGIKTMAGGTTKKVASNGTSASASASGLLIDVDPAGQQVLTLDLGASASAVDAAAVTPKTPKTPKKPKQPKQPTKPKKPLPDTGGSPVTPTIGLGLAALGLVGVGARRRRRIGRS